MNTFYEYYRAKTDGLGDYIAFQHDFRDHMRSEMLGQIDSLSAYFSQRIGLKTGDVYTLLMPTVIEGIILFFALNKIGVIVNFVHPQVPPKALAQILKDTSSKGVAVHEMMASDYSKVIAEAGIPEFSCPRGDYASALKYRGDVLKVEATRDSVALYLQGGGTTGKSRTIMLTNENLMSFCDIYCQQLGITAYPGIDTSINCMPLFHCYGLLGASFMPMCRGVRMVFLPKFDAAVFIKLMKLNHVTMIRGVPNMFRKLLANSEWDGPHLGNLVSIVSGGDSLSATLRGEIDYTLSKNQSRARIKQGYGLTECCGAVMNTPPDGPADDTIGRPFSCNRIEIWGADHKALPEGEIGEIVVSGPTVMKGYLSPRHMDNVGVYRDGSGRRWMLTGDLGYKKGEYFYFSGRRKRLIIISGYNIYPLDVEKAIRNLPFVKESCAVQGFDEQGKVLVRLFVVRQNNGVFNEHDAREKIFAACRLALNRLAVPRDVRFVKDLPRTRVGKVDFMRLTQLKPSDQVYSV